MLSIDSIDTVYRWHNKNVTVRGMWRIILIGECCWIQIKYTRKNHILYFFLISIIGHNLPLFKTCLAVRQRKQFNFLMARPCGSDSLGTRRPDHIHHWQTWYFAMAIHRRQWGWIFKKIYALFLLLLDLISKWKHKPMIMTMLIKKTKQ